MAAVAQKNPSIVGLTDLPEGQWVQFVTAFTHQAVKHFPSPFKVLARDRSFEAIDPGRARVMDVQGKAHDHCPRMCEIGDFGIASLWNCQAKVLTQEEAKKLLGTDTFDKLEKVAAEKMQNK